jgi:hypothetical protein
MVRAKDLFYQLKASPQAAVPEGTSEECSERLDISYIFCYLESI